MQESIFESKLITSFPKILGDTSFSKMITENAVYFMEKCILFYFPLFPPFGTRFHN